MHHREPGPVLALVEDPRACVELIADGVHLHPEVLRWAATSAPHRFLLVTDAMGAAGAADGDYVLGPAAVQVRDGVARLASNGAIAGSTLTMDRAVRYAVQTAGLPLDAVVEAATATPGPRCSGSPTSVPSSPAAAPTSCTSTTSSRWCAVMRAGAWLG